MSRLVFPEITCEICGKMLDLSVDLSADESGKAVHTECYARRLFSARRLHAVEQLFDDMAMQEPILCCPRCGLRVSHVNTTFLSQHGKVWTIPLPFCGKCDQGSGLFREDCA